ncbi:MAG: hypothetical protein QOE68_4635 [Thermoanaerobaculia bacterium]|jgi:hypothetical protein|nr:hypothetical protein [Thermoanaerobaculia bacterium]
MRSRSGRKATAPRKIRAEIGPDTDERKDPAPHEPWIPYLGGLGNRCVRAFAEWVAHSLLLLAIFAVIKGLREAVAQLGFTEKDSFLNVVKIHYLFDAADFALVTALGTIGVIAVVRSYWGKQ